MLVVGLRMFHPLSFHSELFDLKGSPIFLFLDLLFSTFLTVLAFDMNLQLDVIMSLCRSLRASL